MTSHSGLSLIGAQLNRSELAAGDAVSLSRCREPKISHGFRYLQLILYGFREFRIDS